MKFTDIVTWRVVGLLAMVICGVTAYAQVDVDPATPVTQAPRAPGVGRPGMRSISPRGSGGVPATAAQVTTRPATGTDGGGSGDGPLPALKFEQSPVDMVLAAYAEVTGRTLLIAPDIPKAAITLRSNPQTELTKEKYLEAIERILNMNGIVLMPIGEVFLRVENAKTVMKRGFETEFGEAPELGIDPKGQFVSQMVQLKHMPVDEARKAIEGFKRDDGQLQLFERTNSILILDSAENVNRMLEIIKFIDQPLVVREEVNVRTIKYAKAADIKKRLEEVVSESKKETQGKESTQTKTSGAPGVETRRPPALPPGVARARAALQAQTPEPVTPNVVIETLVSDADRGMIRGRVNIIADERSNQLIIITSKENMAFFDRLITVLDVETAPDVTVEVIRLEHADAEEVAKMINDLIGNAAKKDDAAPTAAGGDSEGRTQTLAEAAEARRAARRGEQAGPETPGTTKVGELNKDNIKVLADKRINGIIIMASKNDIAALKGVINSMDIMLSQVLIETVVLEVGLEDGIEAGIDWVKERGKRAWLTGGRGKDEARNVLDGLMGNALEGAISNTVSTVANLSEKGIAYFTKISGLNLDLVVRASADDSRSKVLASPVIQTMDNKEATIKATELVYLFNGKKAVYTGGETTYEEDYVQKEIGITVTVTPRINAKGNVVMTVKQVFQDKGVDQPVTVNKTTAYYATTVTREINADVIVSSGETIILGGLVKKNIDVKKSGIPFLSKLPLVGWLFGFSRTEEKRSELIVFLTPHVFSSQDEATAEAKRRRESLGQAADGIWTEDWSGSPLAEPLTAKEVLQREKVRLAREEEVRKAKKALKKMREQEEKKRLKREAEEAKEEAKRRAAEAPPAIPLPEPVPFPPTPLPERVVAPEAETESGSSESGEVAETVLEVEAEEEVEPLLAL